MARPAFVTSPLYEMDIGKHVFPTSKFRLFAEALVEGGEISVDEVELAPEPTDAQLLSVLAPEYLADLRSYRHTERTLRSELPISREIVEGCARTAAGTILCVERALECGAAVHLGGGFHHGFADHAEGFCYINDVAIGAAWALCQGWARRVSIIDVDVHQGNGTARIFQGEPRAFTFSIHQERLYPPKEVGDLDIGLDIGAGDEKYLEALEAGLRAAVDGFAPDLAIVVAGVDPFESDVLGSMGLTWGGLEERDRMVVDRLVRCRIPFVTVTGGGYARDISDTVGLHVQTARVVIAALAGQETGPGVAGGGGCHAGQ